MSNTVEIVVKVDNQTAAGAAAVEKSLKSITDAAKSVRTALAGATRSLKDTDGHLRGIHGSGSRASESLGKIGRVASAAGDALADGMSNAASATMQLGTSLGTTAASATAAGGSMTVATGGLNLVIGALLAAAAAAAAAVVGFAALGPTLLLLGGFAGAAHSMLAGLAVAIGTVAIGLGGIGDALGAAGKSSGGGGGGGAAAAKAEEAAARAVQAASRALRDAKRDEVQAIRAVNQARLDEIERLQDLDLALRGSTISQKEAAQALVEAKEKNRRAQQAGSAWEKVEAANAVERAQYQYDSVSEKLDDLTQDKAKAAKVGVEGSDQVQKALQAEAKAHERTVLAAQALSDAKKNVGVAAGGAAGGVNAFNDAMKKLSPNARELVRALIDIKDRFKPIKDAVQDRFLDGWAKSSTDLYDKWEKHLEPMLGKMADKFNGLGKAIMKSLGDSTFIKNIEKASDGFGVFIDHLKDAGTAGIDSFGRISAAATPVLEKIGELIERVFVKFNKWIKKVEESGDLDQFMEDAADNLQLIYDIGGLAFGILGDIISILFPGSKAAGKGVLESAKADLQDFKAWLADPENQTKLREFFKKVGDLIDKLVNLGPVIGDLIDDLRKIHGWFDRVSKRVKAVGTAFDKLDGTIRGAFRRALGWVEVRGDKFVTWAGKLPGRIRKALSGLWDGLTSSFGRALNWISKQWNRLSFKAPSVSGASGSSGGFFSGAASAIGGFFSGNADGGVTRGGWSEINERGREMVRLPTGSLVMPHSNTQNAMMQGGNAVTTLVLKSSGNRLDDLLLELLRGRIRAEGGNVQVVLGKAGVA